MHSRPHRCWGWLISFRLRPLYFQLPPVCSHLLMISRRSRIFLPLRWRWYVPPKRRFTSQKTVFFIVTAVKTSNLKKSEYIYEALFPPALVISQHLIFHFTWGGGGGWFWMIYLRGRRIVVASIRKTNLMTKEKHCKPESEWQRLKLRTSRVLSKPCEYSALIRHQSVAVNRHIVCPQRGSNLGSSNND
jgi:hypothetical protein